MVRQLLFVLVALFTLHGQAQSWCPPGATWTYNAGMALAGFQRLTYTHDTLIGDFNAQVIDRYSAIQYPQPPLGQTYTEPYTSYTPVALITRSDSEVVFLLSGAAWDTLYWFGADPGDHWFPAHVNDTTCAPITVADPGTTVVDGVPLRWLHTLDGLTVMERVGSTWDMFMWCPNWLIDGPTGMRCYSDNEIAYQLASGACEMLVGVNEVATMVDPMIHPNPGSDNFSLSLTPGPHTVTLLDATGRLVLQQRILDEQATIDTSLLPSGIYLVNVDEGMKPVRWVKE